MFWLDLLYKKIPHMKKIFTFLFISVFTTLSFSQNLQLHYGYTGDNNYTLARFELMKGREKSLTYLYTDFDLGRLDGVHQAYFEISHKFFLTKLDERINFHVEYNDGLMINRDREVVTTGIPIHRSYLTGIGFRGKIGEHFVISPTFLFKYYDSYNQLDYQFTLRWKGDFLDEKLTFAGFFDAWTYSPGNDKTKYIVLRTQLQLWYNIIEQLSVGTQFEINQHYFIYDEKVRALGTVAIKWNI